MRGTWKWNIAGRKNKLINFELVCFSLMLGVFELPIFPVASPSNEFPQRKRGSGGLFLGVFGQWQATKKTTNKLISRSWHQASANVRAVGIFQYAVQPARQRGSHAAIPPILLRPLDWMLILLQVKGPGYTIVCCFLGDGRFQSCRCGMSHHVSMHGRYNLYNFD